MVAYREKVHVCQWRVKGTVQERVRGKKSQEQNQAPLRARDSSTRGSKRVITDDKIRIVRDFSSPATVGVCAGRRRASEDPACEFGELSGLTQCHHRHKEQHQLLGQELLGPRLHEWIREASFHVQEHKASAQELEGIH